MTIWELKNRLSAENHIIGSVQIELGKKCNSPDILGIYEENGRWYVYDTNDRGNIVILDAGNEDDMTKALYRRILKKEKRKNGTLLTNELISYLQDYSKDKNSNILNTALNNVKIEANKNPNSEYISFKNIIRIYLEMTSDYKNPMLTKICETEDKVQLFYKELIYRFAKENSELSDKGIDKFIKDLKVYTDLYVELVEYLLNNNRYKKDLIEVEGYNAETLCRQYNLTRIGAYNYLMYLREEPQNALADLKANLPRK